MDTILANAGKAFLKAFGAAILVVAIGMATQPQFHSAVAVGIAGVIAAFAAGLSAIQTYIPQLSIQHWVPGLYGKVSDSFLHAFLGAFITAVVGIMQEPSLQTWRALVVAALVGALASGFRAIQASLTVGETPRMGAGLNVPTPELVPAF